MLYSTNYIIARLKDSVDSDDVIRLGAEIEMNLSIEDILPIKKSLEDIFTHKNKAALNPLYIRCLLNYLSD